jgi:hypothetical protein
MAMGAPEQLAAMTALLKPQNQALFQRIVTIWEDLFRPVLTEVIAQGVREGVFDTFDPEGVGDIIQGFAAEGYADRGGAQVRTPLPFRERARAWTGLSQLGMAKSTSSPGGWPRSGLPGAAWGTPRRSGRRSYPRRQEVGVLQHCRWSSVRLVLT